jgi:osmotically inducible protein OsmC
MAVRKAEAQWTGTLREGSGTMRLGSGAFEGSYSFGSRFEDGKGTNPEELIGAAHAGCFSMALAVGLQRSGHTPEQVRTSADVHIEKIGDGFGITRIHLTTIGRVPGLDEATFHEFAEKARANCVVSKALAGVEITLDAKLE